MAIGKKAKLSLLSIDETSRHKAPCLGGSFFLLAFMACSTIGAGQDMWNQAHIRRLGPNLWVAAIEQVALQSLGAPATMGRQRRQNWCWAATVQMALNLAGIQVTQEQVVARIFGGDLDAPANPQQVMNALTGWGLTIRGKPALPQPTALQNDVEMIDDLAHGWPLILGLRNPDGSGHVALITAVTYSQGPNGPLIQTVVYRDPWPYNESRNDIPYSAFLDRRTFVIRDRVAYPQGP
jgi:hypothetical protein